MITCEPIAASGCVHNPGRVKSEKEKERRKEREDYKRSGPTAELAETLVCV